MKAVLKHLMLLAALVTAPAFAAEPDLAGVWQGKLAVAPGQQLTIQFTFTKQPNGSYAAVLNSPDNGGIKDMAASSVSFTGGALKLDVAALSGSYAGALKNGSIDGKWTQPGGVLPLVLTPYQKPVLSAAAVKTLTGAWNGPVTIPGGSLTFVVRFKTNDKGELQGALAVPEQGGVELPISDIEFANDKLVFKVARVGGEFNATYAKDALNGAWKQAGAGMPPEGLPVSLKRGDVAVPVVALKFSSEAFAALNGKWQGRLELPQAPNGYLTIVLRVETNANGQYVAFIDSPDQKALGLPVTEATYDAGKLQLKVGGVGAQYSATVSGKTMTGQWTQGPGNMSLTLTRQ